ncbi:MAG: ROK family protein [Gammaproteobacteria bacterium]|nr:ROK family protein [Gammaproteobacteria bacterium]MBT8055899.1 ROK family protein [Gammaproteobacteria bacterium]NNJ78195.1 ROK family protein [Xanthomonadales bacterium]
MQVLGIDVGGSGIKGALVDLESGELMCDRVRLKTPGSFDIDKVTASIARLIGRFDYEGPVGVGFPAAVANGHVLTPPTAHHVPGWVGQSISKRFSKAAGCEVTVLNDADAAGLAEMRFGAGRDVNGVVITVTLGTGVGGGMFMDSQLVPNLEVGKLYLPGHREVVEQYVASRIRKEANLAWEEYGSRLNEFCLHVEHLFSPQLIIIGGGISQRHKRFLPLVKLKRSRVVPAQMRNEAGITGAAAWASYSG